MHNTQHVVFFLDSIENLKHNCVLLHPNGDIALTQLNIDNTTVRTLCDNKIVTIVLPGRYFIYRTIILPKLSYKNLKAALPYALEEQLAQPKDTLFFAFDRKHMSNDSYLITIGEKQYLDNIKQWLIDNDIPYNYITTSWCAIDEHTTVTIDDLIFINNTEFKGVLPTAITQNMPILSAINDTKYHFQNQITETIQWLAQQIHKKPIIILHKNTKPHKHIIQETHHWVIRSLQLLACSLTLIMCLKVMLLAIYTYKVHDLNKQLTSIQTKANSHPLYFWYLFNQITPLLKESTVDIQTISWSNGMLSITLQGNHVTQLKNIAQHLANLGIFMQSQLLKDANQQVNTLWQFTL